MRRDRNTASRSPQAALKVLGGLILVIALFSLLQLGSITGSVSTATTNNALRENTPEPTTKAPTETPKQEQKKEPEVPVIPEPVVNVKTGSKGIIMCLHNRLIPLGASLIRELRCLGNNEPIEIYQCNNELSKSNIDLLHAVDSNLRIIDACKSLVDRGVFNEQLANTFRSYWIKPLALHQTEFDEVILIDADDLLLKDPAKLRDIAGYKEKGTVFFYDRVIRDANFFNRWYEPSPGAKKVHYLPYWLEHFDYERFGIPKTPPSQHVLKSDAYNDRTCHEQDSSLVLIDKSRSGKAMAVLWFLITEQRFRVEFSLGDKESFWLAYEFARAPYFFSPWGASVISSQPNGDVERYEATLCGSLCHYNPVEDNTPELLYINGRAALDFVPFNLEDVGRLRRNLIFTMLVTHMTPRQKRKGMGPYKNGEHYEMECNVGLGKTPTPPVLRHHLWRRRLHFLAISMSLLEPLKSCDMGGKPTLFSD
ncbi:hypothetical protein Poli38472_014171 [Pythium oligandrum]|uniref:Uncharacterized protein n=1 Tax=Pythium oligandrum TaxID=41045 RepID=A0A8K1CJ84_PYTOL|nr:hypothetical protein Poli38472_014171 [Pythium oligandrum]|eukprot:TMW64054.1 hypothetical protein Poli38472_014171 [Pythium oligandrum]